MAKKNRNKKEQFDDYLDEKQFWGNGKKSAKKRKRNRRNAEQLVRDMTVSQDYDTYYEELYEDEMYS